MRVDYDIRSDTYALNFKDKDGVGTVIWLGTMAARELATLLFAGGAKPDQIYQAEALADLKG